MKKLLTICLSIIFALTFAVAFVGCKPKDNATSARGLLYKKVSGEDFYTVYGYEGDENSTICDLGAIAEEKGIVIGRITKNAFSGDNTIEKLIVPTTVTEIGKGAFEKMSKLEEITLPFFGKNANGEAFLNQTPASKDKAVKEEATFGYVFGTEEYECGAKINNSYDGSTAAEYYIPTTLTKVVIKSNDNYVVPMYAFYGVTQITDVELVNVKEIGEFAFAECVNIEKVSIPATVSKIYKNAFECCENLTNEGLTLADGYNLAQAIGDSQNVFENTGVELN